MTGEFQAGPRKSPCARGVWQGLWGGGPGVCRFWGSSSSGSQDFLPEAMLCVLSQPCSSCHSDSGGWALLHILSNPCCSRGQVLLSHTLGVGHGDPMLLKLGCQPW